MALCPPIVAVGGDGAMLDIGFQNLSRLLASGKPIRVVVLDTQVYSNTGGQACTSGFTGQVSDMAGFGAAQHGKTEVRKELALIAIAHRGAYVLQSSQASPSHLHRGRAPGPLLEAPRALQPLHAVPGRARPGRRRVAPRGAARAREPRVPVPRVRPGEGDVLRRRAEPRGQPRRRGPLADLRARPRRRRRQAQQGRAAADDRRLGPDRGAVRARTSSASRARRGPRRWSRSRSTCCCPRETARGRRPTSSPSTPTSASCA